MYIDTYTYIYMERENISSSITVRSNSLEIVWTHHLACKVLMPESPYGGATHLQTRQ